MLYGKIYLDRDDSGRDLLVFVSLAAESPIERQATECVDYIAISPEAKELLLAKINAPERKLSRLFGDFLLYGNDGWEHGYFSFRERSVEGGQRYRTLGIDEPISLKLRDHGCRRAVLEYMIPCDNELLKSLDLGESIDENTLWDRHFAAMRERGELLSADTATIKKTPLAYLTGEQKELIRRDFEHRFNSYDAYHRINSTDEVMALVVAELTLNYSKSPSEIEEILTTH